MWGTQGLDANASPFSVSNCAQAPFSRHLGLKDCICSEWLQSILRYVIKSYRRLPTFEAPIVIKQSLSHPVNHILPQDHSNPPLAADGDPVTEHRSIRRPTSNPHRYILHHFWLIKEPSVGAFLNPQMKLLSDNL
jgi:hypothetical protein